MLTSVCVLLLSCLDLGFPACKIGVEQVGSGKLPHSSGLESRRPPPESICTFFFQQLTFGRKVSSPSSSPSTGLIRLNEGPGWAQTLSGHQLMLSPKGRVGEHG